jgi:hypothetical protein
MWPNLPSTTSATAFTPNSEHSTLKSCPSTVALRLDEHVFGNALRLVQTHLRGKAALVRRAQDRPADEQQAVHLVIVQPARAHRRQQPIKPAQNAEGFPAALGAVFPTARMTAFNLNSAVGG